MVKQKMLIDEFALNFPKRGRIIFDIQNNSSIDLAGFKKKVASAYVYFSLLRHTKEDKVVIFLENSIDYIAVLIALFDVNIVVVPLNPLLNKAKTVYFIKHSKAKFILTSQEILSRNEWLAQLDCRITLTSEIFQLATMLNRASRITHRCLVQDNDIKFIMYTSGTIGNPKGVMLSRKSVKLKIINLIKLLKFKPCANFFSFLPFFSGHGMIPGMLVPFLSGCRIYIGRFDAFLAFRFWALVIKYRINYFTSVPGILVLLKEHIRNVRKQGLRCIRSIFSASSQLSQPIYDWYCDYLGIHIRNCYGLTETASWISININPSKQKKANCVGKALDGYIGVFDRRGKRLKHDQIGEFCLKSPFNMSGYFKNQKATKSCISADGLLKTGDTGYIDSSGNIFILGRIKHIIIKNGINVYPLEIDQVFLRHPDVKDSISFGVPDEHYGEKIITALIVSDSNKSKDKYCKYAMKKLPSFLIPNDFFFPISLPVGQIGKVVVDSVRKQYLKEG
jgi:acyl-CoA synthetase (AMP-forming)/AMP-acid ligase II